MNTPGVLSGSTRVEHDLLGDLSVPAERYYGVHTQRALENFPISGQAISAYPHLVAALAVVKQAAARANGALGLLSSDQERAIIQACKEIRSGSLLDEFVVDVIQGGAGTSSNMNANEVIANRALEILGQALGDYHVIHPLDHVNCGQSTNDVYPTAIKLALDAGLRDLLTALQHLIGAFQRKGVEFAGVAKMGRTQLQDAVPMTLGQEFTAFAMTLSEDADRIREALLLLHEVNLGGTAIGTELNAHPGYRERVLTSLRELTGIATLVSAPDLIEATADTGVFVHVSGALKRLATKLSKICNDLRLLSSGPRAGLGEINLPAQQAGSSIMPGKVNPVIAEVVNQVAYEVIGNDLTVTMASEAGQLQLNAFEPIIAHCLLSGISHLSAAMVTLADRCVVGITANAEFLRMQVERSIGLATMLSPTLGYATATAIAMEAMESGRTVAEVAVELSDLTTEEVRRLLAVGSGQTAAAQV